MCARPRRRCGAVRNWRTSSPCRRRSAAGAWPLTPAGLCSSLVSIGFAGDFAAGDQVGGSGLHRGVAGGGAEIRFGVFVLFGFGWIALVEHDCDQRFGFHLSRRRERDRGFHDVVWNDLGNIQYRRQTRGAQVCRAVCAGTAKRSRQYGGSLGQINSPTIIAEQDGGSACAGMISTAKR